MHEVMILYVRFEGGERKSNYRKKNLNKTDDYNRYNRISGTTTRKRLIEWGKV